VESEVRHRHPGLVQERGPFDSCVWAGPAFSIAWRNSAPASAFTREACALDAIALDKARQDLAHVLVDRA
jgi:hypothetical protein